MTNRPDRATTAERIERGFGPYVTRIEVLRPDGLLATWDSRRHRKHVAEGVAARTWWDPRARGWWIAVLFAAGSVCFAVGATPGYTNAVGAAGAARTFFVGSLLFTSAAYLAYREAVDAGPVVGGERRRKVLVWEPGRIDWTATGVQLIGTVFFNVTTAFALSTDLTEQAAMQHVWRPDALGSVCFLVASALAWFEVCHGWWAWQPHGLAWWITLLNLVGSVAFGVSAVASFIVPSTGELWNAELTNLGTLVGALCFLAGAVLLLPERTEQG